VTERVEEWDSRPFSGGYGALQDLAAEEFSGVVRAGGADLYVTSGTVVGVRNGTIAAFEDASGTVYEAPTPALPLLAVMQDRGEESRAQYYSEDTAIAEVDTKLEDGGFTGYIELSENVLSGDYYVVYHGGRSMSVAFVGNTGQLLEGDEAFQRADGEVGIYEVYPATIDPIEIPEPTGSGSDREGTADSGTVAATADVATDPEARPDEDPESAGTDEESGRTEAGETSGQEEAGEESRPAGTDEKAGQSDPDEGGGQPDHGDDGGGDVAAEAATAGTAPESGNEGSSARTASANVESGDGRRADHADDPAAGRDDSDRIEAPDSADGPESDPSSTGSSGHRAESRASTEPAGPRGGPPRDDRRHEETGHARSDPARSSGGPADRDESSVSSTPDRGPPQEEGSRGTDSPTAGTADGYRLETRAIPSLDPGRSQSIDRTPEEERSPADPNLPETRTPGPEPESRPDGPAVQRRDAPAGRPGGREHGEATPGRESAAPDPGADRRDTAAGGAREAEAPDSGSGAVDPDRIEELEAEVDDREAEIDRLEAELQTATEDRDRLESELESVREERDELDAEVERLESELERLETEFGAATERDRRITVGEALDGTDIFLRYHSKGDATLEKAHSSNTRQADVIENIRLEKHTQFDADAVAIGGRSYGEFIEGTVVYQFVDWVATELLFEIRDTGHTDALKTLYDALPNIDRAELNGSVEVAYSEDGQETRSTESFDVVLRDRMGTPLVVANLNDSREAASETMMERLITAAERVGQTTDDFAAAFFVTESFFEPGALETASEATRSGLLSRSKQKSFVNLSRKRGYHLCLVEARSQNFNLTVPEL
jgi:hypothetical protein